MTIYDHLCVRDVHVGGFSGIPQAADKHLALDDFSAAQYSAARTTQPARLYGGAAIEALGVLQA